MESASEVKGRAGANGLGVNCNATIKCNAVATIMIPYNAGIHDRWGKRIDRLDARDKEAPMLITVRRAGTKGGRYDLTKRPCLVHIILARLPCVKRIFSSLVVPPSS